MSTKKRSSNRAITVPGRSGDSVHGIHQKNLDKSKTKNDEKKAKIGVEGVNGDFVGGNTIMKETEVGNGFVGDLNGDCFPALNSQVHTPSVNDRVNKNVSISDSVSASLNVSNNENVNCVVEMNANLKTTVETVE